MRDPVSKINLASACTPPPIDSDKWLWYALVKPFQRGIHSSPKATKPQSSSPPARTSLQKQSIPTSLRRQPQRNPKSMKAHVFSQSALEVPPVLKKPTGPKLRPETSGLPFLYSPNAAQIFLNQFH